MWSKKDYPLIEVGSFELNRNAGNWFADVEQAAFNPANVVQGIGFSPRKMLQGRLFSYGDAQRYRLSVNHHPIPVNPPRAARHYNRYHRDGLICASAAGDAFFGSITAHLSSPANLMEIQAASHTIARVRPKTLQTGEERI